MVLDYNVDLEGAPNPLALLLCRGAGECDINWEDDGELEKWGKLPICEEHTREYLIDWYNPIYHHIKIKKPSREKVNITTSL